MAGEMPLLNDATTVNYVRALGGRLASHAPGHDFPYQFEVVNAREINAFALPGGFVFVHAGAIAAARGEGELAGVIAHEIAHVALRHGTNQASKAYIAQAGLGVLGAIAGGGDDTNAGDIINTIGGAGANMLFLKFGRTAETQADLEGARIMAAAGYDPRDMARFFETLAEQGGGGRGVPEMLSDHPDPGNRVAAINEILPSLKLGPNPTRDTQEFQQVKARLTGGQLPRAAGLARTGPSDPNDVKPGARPPAPSSTLREYSSPDGASAFGYPENWQALRLEGADANLIFAPHGAYGEMDDSVYVTHGIFVGVVQPPAADLAQATQLFVEEQIRVNADFRVQRGPQPVSFAGGQAGYATIVAGPSTVTGVVEIDVIYTTVTRDGRLFYLITMAPEDEYERYQPAFEQIIRSLRLGQ
jgi:beta-barrel assembly-enhancing protease